MARETNPLEGIIRRVIDGMVKGERPHEEEIDGAWRRAVGEAAANHTRPVALKKHTLIIHVDGSGWLYELTVRRDEIIRRLEEIIKKDTVREIRFRIGDIKKKKG